MEWHTVSRLSLHMNATREGYVVVRDVVVARTGTQIYWGSELPGLEPDESGTISVHRDPAEVFEPESLASFNGKPITNGHPEGLVGPENWSALSLGFGANARRGQPPDDDTVVADLVLTTRKDLDLVRAGRRAISIGYVADYDQTAPGYGRQRNIRANHFALVDEGRCGTRCVIHDGRSYYSDASTQRGRSAMRTRDELPLGYDPRESQTGKSPTAIAKYPVGGKLIMLLSGDLTSYYVDLDPETGQPALFQTIEAGDFVSNAYGSSGAGFRNTLDHAGGERAKLAAINRANKEFWTRNGGLPS
jgi:hypothetical protein